MATALVAMLLQAQVPFSLDTTFRMSIQSWTVNSVIPLPDGKLIASGRLRFQGELYDQLLVRLLPNGERDESFNNSALGGGELTAWEDRLYVSTAQTVRRILLNGAQDPTFIEMNSDPLFLSSQFGGYHVFPDGRVVMSGTHTLHDSIRGFVGSHQFIWFTNTGHLDTTRIHRKGSGALNRFKKLPDGKFIISGYASTFEGRSVSRVFRMLADGSLDTTFNSGVEWGWAQDYHALADGRVYATGLFKITGVADTLGFIRMLPDGSLDPTFNNHLRWGRGDLSGYPFFPGTPSHIYKLDEGRFIIAGAFRTVNEEERGGICLVDTNGTLLNSAFSGPGCGYYYHNASITYGFPVGIVRADNDFYYIFGAYHGYDDGETNDPEQRFISRLFGGELPPEPVGTGSIEQERIGSTFHVYPNPSRDNTTLTYTLTAQTGQAQVRLLDLAGRELEAYTLRGNEGRLLLATQAFAPGLYLVELRMGGSLVEVRKLVVE